MEFVQTFKGLVLKSIDYKESDKLLTILTLEKGKIFVRARGVKKSASKLKAFCQSFSYAEFDVIQGHAGLTIAGVNGIDNFFELTRDLEKYSYGFSVLEILDKITAESESYPSVFVESLKCLKTLTYSDIEPRLVLCKFIVSVLSFEGFRLNLNDCPRCKTPLVSPIYFDLGSGEILCSACRTFESIEIEKGVFSTFKILSQNDYDKLKTIKIPKNILEKSLNALVQNLSYNYEFKIN